MSTKKIILAFFGLIFLGALAVFITILIMAAQLPQLMNVDEYKPLLVSKVYSNNGELIGEFFRERRTIVSSEEIPEKLKQAFIAAEDASFYEHTGFNLVAIARAFIANMKAGRTVQGGSTITQQVAKSFFLTSERTYTRKIKEVIMAYRMETHLTKEQILYLYLNQIYLGQGAYGVAAAAETYFRKPLKDLTLAEMAIIAGLPQAPSSYTPTRHPDRAKQRQIYVLQRMAEENFITREEMEQTINEPVTVFLRESFQDKAPHFVEIVRQYLVKALGETAVLDEGLSIYTSIDLEKQLAAQQSVQDGLRALDKRQGYRGPIKNISDTEEIAQFLLKTRDNLMDDYIPMRTIMPDGKAVPEKEPLNLNPKPGSNVPEYIPLGTIVEGIVTKVDDQWGLVTVRFAESIGLIDLSTMLWAREPNPNVPSSLEPIKKPSDALKVGDIIKVKVVADKFSSERVQEMISSAKKRNKRYTPQNLPEFEKFAAVELEQDPTVEASLLSIDLNNYGILAMVGGYNFQESKFNRALQAVRQTGSSFKPLVYAAALDKGFTPNSIIVDAPLVYEEEGQVDDNQDLKKANIKDAANQVKRWKPSNYSERFSGDILFRTALIKSLNIPTVKILEKVGVHTVANYARRMGVFSSLNMDLSLGLGSSGMTLYEMTKVYSTFANLGKRVRPIFITKVEDRNGDVLIENISLDMRFEEEIKALDTEFEEKRLAVLSDPNLPVSPTGAKGNDPIYFQDPEQLISQQTAYLMTSLLRGVVEEGTGQRAKALGRPTAGKTGTTNGYFDAWFMGYTPQISTGVWVGSDQEKTLGRGETGSSAALPIWLEYMKVAHEDLEEKTFSMPSGIVMVNIDGETGKLATASSKKVVRQPLLEGTEPTQTSEEEAREDQSNFFKEDLSE